MSRWSSDCVRPDVAAKLRTASLVRGLRPAPPASATPRVLLRHRLASRSSVRLSDSPFDPAGSLPTMARPGCRVEAHKTIYDAAGGEFESEPGR